MKSIRYFHVIIFMMMLFISGCNLPFDQGYAEEHITQWKNSGTTEEMHSTYRASRIERECSLFKVQIPLGKWKIEVMW